MIRKMYPLLTAVALLLTLTGWAAIPAKAAQCTVENGQLLIDTGQYRKAITEFTCVINNQPTEVEGYRGRMEAELMLGLYSDAVLDFTRVTALVVPTHPDAEAVMLAGYNDRLTANPDSIPALMGKSFTYWCFFEYNKAIPVLNHLLDIQPDNLYGNLFRGSSRLLSNTTKAKGAADLEKAIALAPTSADVRFLVADAYTYGQPDPARAFAEASLALDWGLDTPRIHAILAASYHAFGDSLSEAEHIQIHIDAVTTELVTTAPIAPDTMLELDLVPGRTYEIPVHAAAGETISIATSSGDIWDTILVLLGPDGSLTLGSDDTHYYFAAFEYVVGETGTYRILVTSFESASTGELVVTRE